jgi:hypothetical protein
MPMESYSSALVASLSLEMIPVNVSLSTHSLFAFQMEPPSSNTYFPSEYRVPGKINTYDGEGSGFRVQGSGFRAPGWGWGLRVSVED